MDIGIIFGIAGFILQLVPAIQRMTSQFTNSAWRNEIPDVNALIEMRNRGLITADRYVETMGRHGIAQDYSVEVLEANRLLLSAYEYVTLYRRKLISKQELNEKLERVKLKDEDIDNLLNVTKYFPSPSDLVQFAVREVYSPEIVQKFGQMEDIPPIFLNEAKKAGLEEDQARNYWAAHWQLPGINQGFEMLHRRVIDQDTLNLLLKSLDVMPFWRDKLTQISYNPLTRVDVRRMYGLGVLDAQGVYNAYLDSGYNYQNAELMTHFTIEYENAESKGITRASLISAYEDFIITKEELSEYLKSIRYSDAAVKYWVSIADYQRTTNYVKKYTQDLTELFQMGAIDIEEVRNKLLEEDLPARYIDQVLTEILKARAKRTKVPSKSELENWLRTQLIDEKYYVIQMRLLGYPDSAIQLYLAEIALTQDTASRKFLQITVYQRWLKSGIMSIEDFETTAILMEYSQDDIYKLIEEVKGREIETTE